MAGRGHRDIFTDQIDWAPGTDPGVTYTRFLLDEGNAQSPMVVLSRFEAGSRVGPHTHGTNYCEYIIEGSQTVGKTTFGKGDVRLVTGGTGYGPIEVGPEGCTVLIVFQEASGSMMQPLGKDRVLAEAQ